MIGFEEENKNKLVISQFINSKKPAWILDILYLQNLWLKKIKAWGKMIFVFAAGAWFPDAQNRAEDKETAQCGGFRENMRRQFLRQKVS